MATHPPRLQQTTDVPHDEETGEASKGHQGSHLQGEVLLASGFKAPAKAPSVCSKNASLDGAKKTRKTPSVDGGGSIGGSMSLRLARQISEVAKEAEVVIEHVAEAAVEETKKQYKIEKQFMAVVGALFLIGWFVTPYPEIARWYGFALAGYSAIANDSIQTLGPFLASNRDQKWYFLYFWVAGIFVATACGSFFTLDGDVSYGRLMAKGYDQTPETFEYLQVVCPAFLLLLTRFKMPVSTTFLLLSSFAQTGKAIGAVIEKSLFGYVIAFFLSLFIWGWKGAWMHAYIERGPPESYWKPIQWASSGALWSFWLMQDAANIAVYLPRQLSPAEFAAFVGTLSTLLLVLMARGGERIQEIVDSKTDATDLRGATGMSLVFAVILIIFKEASDMPMSTTWVFIGILGGREAALSMNEVGKSGPDTLREIYRDTRQTVLGFAMSLLLASMTNPVIREGLFQAATNGV